MVVVADEEGGAVGRGGLERLRGELAAGAGLVLDDDRLAEHLAQPLGQQPGDGIGAAAGGEADQQPDRAAVGAGRRPGGGGQCGGPGGQDGAAGKAGLRVGHGVGILGKG